MSEMVKKKSTKSSKAKKSKTQMNGDRIGYIVALKDSTWPRQQELNIENQHREDADAGEKDTGRRLLDQTGTRYANWGQDIWPSFSSKNSRFTQYMRSRREWNLRNENDNLQHSRIKDGSIISNLAEQKDFGNFYEPLAIFESAVDTQAYVKGLIDFQENNPSEFKNVTGAKTALTHEIEKHRGILEEDTIENYKKLPTDGVYDSVVIVPVNLGALPEAADKASDEYLAGIAVKQNVRYMTKYPTTKSMTDTEIDISEQEKKEKEASMDAGDMWETLTYPAPLTTSEKLPTDSYETPLFVNPDIDKIREKLKESSNAGVVSTKILHERFRDAAPSGGGDALRKEQRKFDIDKREAAFILNMMLDDRDGLSWKKNLYPNAVGKASAQDKKFSPALANVSAAYTSPFTGKKIGEAAPKNMSIYTFDDYEGSASHGSDGDEGRRNIDKFEGTVSEGWSGPMRLNKLDVNPLSTIQKIMESKITSDTEIDKRLAGVPSPIQSGDFKSGASKRWGARVNNNQLRQMVDDTLGHKRPLMIWGPPGIGKSQAIEQVVNEKKEELGADNFRFEDLRLSQLESVDLRGIPDVTGNVTQWKKPSFLPTSGKGILFLDEFNQATPEVQNAAFQLILDRKIGDYKVPDGWAIVAAGNRPQDLGFPENETPQGTVPMSPALANRFRHVVLKVPTTDGWLSWADKGDAKLRTKKSRLMAPNILVTPDKELMKHKKTEDEEFEADSDHSYAFSHGIAKYKVDERITGFIREKDAWAGGKFLFSMTDKGESDSGSEGADVKAVTITQKDMGELNSIKSAFGEEDSQLIDDPEKGYTYQIQRGDAPVDIAFPSPRQWEYLSDTLGAMPEREYLKEGTLLDKDGSQILIVDRKTKIQALKDIGKWKDSMSRKEADKVLAANESEIDKKMIEKFRPKMEGKLKGEIDVQESGTWWATVYNKDTNYTRIKNMKEESTDINDVSDKALASVGYMAGSAFRQSVTLDSDYLGKTQAGKALGASEDYDVASVGDYVFPADNVQLESSLLANVDALVDDAVSKGKEKQIVAAFYTMLTRRRTDAKLDKRIKATPNGGWTSEESEKLRTLYSYFNRQMLQKSKTMNTLSDISDVISKDASLSARLHYALDKKGFLDVKSAYPQKGEFKIKKNWMF